MNDVVLIDLHKQLDREEEWDNFQLRVESRAEEIRQQYLDNPQQFAEITELLYHDDLQWPIEEHLTQMIKSRKANTSHFNEVSRRLTMIFEERLDRYCSNLAFTQIKMND
jgi:hypothetical protein